MPASAAAAAVAGGLTLTGGILEAVQRKKLQRREMKYNSAEALKNRQFQQGMFDQEVQLQNTAYQRSMADMKAAGLNPIMMYGSGGPAGTPGGLGGAQAAPADLEPADMSFLGEAADDAISTALEVKQIKMAQKAMEKDLEKRDEEIDNLSADTDKKAAEKRAEDANAAYLRQLKVKLGWDAMNSAVNTSKTEEEVKNYRAKYDVLKAEADALLKQYKWDHRLGDFDAVVKRVGSGAKAVEQVAAALQSWKDLLKKNPDKDNNSAWKKYMLMKILTKL